MKIKFKPVFHLLGCWKSHNTSLLWPSLMVQNVTSFTFGWARSSLLCKLFSGRRDQLPVSSHGSWGASPAGERRLQGVPREPSQLAQNLRSTDSSSSAQAQELWPMGLAAPWYLESSWTWYQTHESQIGRQTLNHWATREVLKTTLLMTMVTAGLLGGVPQPNCFCVNQEKSKAHEGQETEPSNSWNAWQPFPKAA